MENNSTVIQQTTSDEISLKELIDKVKSFISYLKTKWLNFLIVGIIGGALGLIYYYIQTPKYTAECTFIIDEKNSSGGGLAGLASQLGFDVGGTTQSSLFAGENILEIIASKNIITKVLLSKVDSTSDQTLADLFLDFTKLKQAYSKNERLKEIAFNKVASPNEMSLLQDSILNLIYTQVKKSYLTVDWVRKKASLIKVDVASRNEKFSKYLTERVIEESRKLYVNIKTGTAQANVDRLQRRADSLYYLLNYKSYNAADAQILNANPAMRHPLVESEIAQRDKVVIQTIYGEVVKNLETSKVLLSQQTPVIQIIDKPEFPLVVEKWGRIKSVFVFAFVFGILLFIYLSGKYLIKHFTLK